MKKSVRKSFSSEFVFHYNDFLKFHGYKCYADQTRSIRTVWKFYLDNGQIYYVSFDCLVRPCVIRIFDTHKRKIAQFTHECASLFAAIYALEITTNAVIETIEQLKNA